MYVRSNKLDDSEIRAVIERVNREEYRGNIWIENLEQISRNAYRLKLGTYDSYAYGSRTSASGRHGRYLSWQAFRDVFAALFEADPTMTIRTAMATYKGVQGFEAEYPKTGDQNVGSLVAPAYMPELSV